jgi:N-acyl-D-aspartate/D-glutamate deacylase
MSGLDLVIRGGLVVDGTGAEGHVADVGISGGRIAQIGRIATRGTREIDAEGHAVTPGFIDGHTHLDAQMHWDARGTNSCWHGVTTAVMGNCGFTVAPIRAGQQHLVARNLERAEDISASAMAAGIDWRWEGFDEYLGVIDTMPKGINYAAYIGHSALRTWAMGERAFEEAANEDDLVKMEGELRRAFDAGAAGFTTSRSAGHETSDDRPVASRLATRDELARLVGTMKHRPRLVFELANEHFRPGNPEEARWYDWLGRLVLESGVMTTFGLTSRVGIEQLKFIETMTAKGGRMFGQSHSRGVNSIFSFESALPFDKLPVWTEFRAQSLEAQASGLREPATRQALVDAVKTAVYGRTVGTEARPPDWDLCFVYDKPLPPYRSIASIAAERGVDPLDAMLDAALAKDLKTLFWQPVTSDEHVVPIMSSPLTVMTFSDSGAHVSQIADASIQSHLIAYWCREKKVFTLPQAVEMMTGRAARAWGFADRGVIREGYVADLNVFDPATFGPLLPEVVNDLPTGARRLSQRSTGLKATLIDGVVTIENGEHTGVLPGKLLRRNLA